MFPPGAELSRNVGMIASENRFWVVPSSRGPRWILPNSPGHAWSFVKQWRPYKVSSRIRWLALLAAYQMGQLCRAPNIVSLGISGYEDQTWDHLGWSGSEPPVPVIYIGTPGPARKAIVGLVDRQTHCITTVAKVPLGSDSRRAIAHEADILERLDEEKPGLAPRTLFMNYTTGATLQDALDGEPTSRKLTQTHIKWLLKLVNTEETFSLRKYAQGLAEQIGGYKDIDRGTIDALLCMLSEIDASWHLPSVWVHGDFAPWNLVKRQGGSIAALDWENALPRGLPLFDLIYFISIQAFLFGERRIISAPMKPMLRHYLDCLGIDPGVFRKLFLMCLVEDWLRCNDAGNRQRALFLFRHLRKESENME